MRKLIIVFLAVSFLAACNNNKKDPRDDRRTDKEKDDYRDKEEDNKDSKTTDYKDDTKTTDVTSGGWKSSEVEIFVTNCTDEAAKGGMVRSKAQEYCECMQRKLEVMYPNAADVGNIDTESASMQDMIKKCLGM